MSDIPIFPIIFGSLPFVAASIYLFFAFNDSKSSHKTRSKNRTHKPQEMKTIKQITLGGTKKYKRI